MPKITELVSKIVDPNLSFRVDPDEIGDLNSEKSMYDLVTPYENDHLLENGFRVSLVDACLEVKGLDALLDLDESYIVKKINERHVAEALRKEGIDYYLLSDSEREKAFRTYFEGKRLGV
jgi:hypothetical protein